MNEYATLATPVEPRNELPLDLRIKLPNLRAGLLKCAECGGEARRLVGNERGRGSR
jgi:hypothetical protein